jgi:hypothetical protein
MMKTTSVKQIRRELREIKSRLRLVERQVNQLEVAETLSPEDEFRRKFPEMKVDRRWFKLVGSLPPVPVEEDEHELTQILEEIYRR